MSRSVTLPPAPPTAHAPPASPVPRHLRGAGEAVLFALVAASPWPFASNDPPFESALAAGVLLLMALWSAHTAAGGRFAVRVDVVTVCLGGIALWSAVQLVPLPESVVGVVSPARLEWHRTLTPDVAELVPGEAGETLRPTVLTLSVDPSATRTFLARVLAVLLVYAAARNWLATPASFRRLAWALTVNGVALAVLALGQFFSSAPNVLYWSLRCEGNVFGPFVCRNHYPDYAAMCLGLTVGLLLSRERARGTASPPGALAPRSVALATAAGLLGASVAFSLSRAGILATAAGAAGAWALSRGWRRESGSRSTWAVLAGAALVAVGVFAWFGTERVERRLGTLASTEAAASRAALWRDAVRLVPRFWATGTGDGTFVWAEPVVRTGRLPAAVEHAHNEYLEAAVEGGAIRLGLTLLLVAGLAVTAARGFLRKRGRSSAPLLLGAWFGLSVVALHAAVEFAVHMPAVALLAATVAGYAMAASGPAFERPVRAPHGPRWWAGGAGLAAAGLALFVALDARSREQVHRLKAAADLVYRDTASPTRLARRAGYLDARVALRPDDPAVLFDAAQGRIDAAVEETLAGAGPGAEPPDRFPPAVVSRHLVPALRFLRAARAANPIAPKPHTRLGFLAEHLERSEPAAGHLDRAKRLLPSDPDLWYTSGRAALRRGDPDAAWADWRTSLVLSPRHLAPVLAAAREVLPPDEIRARVLPDDPVLLLTAADQLFPDREGHAAARRPLLEAAAACGSRADSTAPQLASVARAHDELGRTDEAVQAWRRAVDAAPENVSIRDGYCRWLEQQERYEEAVMQLEWLRSQAPRATAQDRLDAARHGLKLQQELDASRPRGPNQLDPP